MPAIDGVKSRTVAFEARDVSREYPGVIALDGVSLMGYAGEVLAICGANGAGKSTFSKLLAGQEQPSSVSRWAASRGTNLRSPPRCPGTSVEAAIHSPSGLAATLQTRSPGRGGPPPATPPGVSRCSKAGTS